MPDARLEEKAAAEAAAGAAAAGSAGPARANRLGLRFEDCRFSVGSADVEDLRWLAAFLECGFEEAPCTAPDHEVDLVVDARAFERLAGAAGTANGTVEGFAKDSDSVLFERLPSAGPATVFRDARHPLFYVVGGGLARVEVVAPERTRRCRIALMRVVRELAMARTVSTGGLLVHAAAVRTAGGGVVVLCGPKGSGKTTLVMSLLVHAPGAAYVANDRCVVRANGSGTAATVRGLPTLVSIRSDTLERFPVVRARLDGVRPEAASRPRATVTPPEFIELVGRPARAPGGPLLALVFPRVGAGPNRLALRRLGPAEAEARLREGLFRAGRTSPLGDVFVPPGAEPAAVAGRVREEADRAVRRLAADVPCFECLLGGGAPPGAAECRALLANVGAAAG